MRKTLDQAASADSPGSVLLDLSRIESGRVEIQREPFRCEEVIAEVTASLAPALAGKALKLESDIPAPLSEVRSDRKRIFQILLNLANNGVKFHRRGRGMHPLRSQG